MILVEHARQHQPSDLAGARRHRHGRSSGAGTMGSAEEPARRRAAGSSSRSRFRAPEHLHDGDVLHYDEAADIVVARIALKDVLVIELEGIETLSPSEILRTCFELGHGLGNQHWPAVIKGTTVYVPLIGRPEGRQWVMRTCLRAREDAFRPRRGDRSRAGCREVLLFAGADATPHHHHAEHDRAHSHDHDHGHHLGNGHHHDHDHQHDHDHSHRHGRAHSQVT